MERRLELSDESIDKICKKLAPMVADVILARMSKRLLTTREKASQLGISEGTLRQWVFQGRIDAIKQGDTKQSRLMFEP